MRIIICLLAIVATIQAGDVTLTWDQPANTNHLAGYQINAVSGTNLVTMAIPVYQLTNTFTNLRGGTNWTFTAYSIGTNGLRSVPSEPLVEWVPGKVIGVSVQQSTNINGPWQEFFRAVLEIEP